MGYKFSITLTEKCRDMLAELCKQTGFSKSVMLGIALENYYRQQKNANEK